MQYYISVCCVLSSLGCAFNAVHAAGKKKTEIVPMFSPRSWQQATNQMNTEAKRPHTHEGVIYRPYNPDEDSSDTDTEETQRYSTCHMLERKKNLGIPNIEQVNASKKKRKRSLPLSIKMPSKSNMLGREITGYLLSPKKSPYTLRELLTKLPGDFAVSFEDIIGYKCTNSSHFLRTFITYRVSKKYKSELSLFLLIKNSEDGFLSCVNPHYSPLTFNPNFTKQLYQANISLFTSKKIGLDSHPLIYFLTFGCPKDMTDFDTAKLLVQAIQECKCTTIECKNGNIVPITDYLNTPLSEIPDTTFETDCNLIAIHEQFLLGCQQKEKFSQSKQFFKDLVT